MTIKVGDYIVVQKQNYTKLHKFNKPTSSITIGKETVELGGIEGKRYFSVFKMIPKGKRLHSLEPCDDILELKDEIDVKVSGTDNRNILDDGRSQKLTASEIMELKDDATKASDIVEKLISNSSTFSSKTEYSQDKYLRKKGKKYFEYLQILKPNIRIISELLYKLDPSKIQNMRIDTLSQMITLANIYSEGNYLLYDSGSNGLVAAALLSAIGANTKGKLVHMHPGNMSQKQALLALNLEPEQYNRGISVNVYSALRQYYQGCDTDSVENVTTQSDDKPNLKRKIESCEHEPREKVSRIDETESNCTTKLGDSDSKIEKKYEEPKKPKWHFDNIAACEVMQQKLDALIIVCKEDPQNIFYELIKFVKPGRPFVVYYSVAEPLQTLYTSLKSESTIAALKLTCNWMRNYQVIFHSH